MRSAGERHELSRLSDRELRERVVAAAAKERVATSETISLLAEFDRRQLYLAEGFSSLFRFCREVLHLSEGAAYKRIQAARAARKWPVVLDRLRDGSISLAVLGTLAPCLTDANCEQLLLEARHRGKRDVELIVARLRPRADVPSVIRKLPAPKLPPESAVAAQNAAARTDAVQQQATQEATEAILRLDRPT